ncbi:MAG: type II toxin-antitoxin system death-on-curing family toxin [Deltaproteobacteria bacterium]|nr:type II toxin-antitoxin system death-on-curing family toxin [Deltaproteobacteria bacterium]
MNPEFLSVDDVIDIHTDQLARYGGEPGLRDAGLLESAVAQPMATFDGEPVHHDLFEMAAAYLFHIVANHPFVDGNKRTGLLAALVFLDLNGITVSHGSDELYELTMAVAEGRSGKREVSTCLRRICAS